MAPATQYSPDMIEQARAKAFEGATDREIADDLGISERTIHRWKIQYPEFGAALATGKEAADRRVEHSLYRRAIGYTFDAEKLFHYQGEVVRAATVEHVPPDTTAAMFWLRNRQADTYRDKRDVTVDLSNLSGGDAAMRLVSMLGELSARADRRSK